MKEDDKIPTTDTYDGSIPKMTATEIETKKNNLRNAITIATLELQYNTTMHLIKALKNPPQKNYDVLNINSLMAVLEFIMGSTQSVNRMSINPSVQNDSKNDLGVYKGTNQN